MLQASKVLALTAANLYADTKIIENAKDELAQRLNGEAYTCPIPEGVPPYIVEG
jgi:aminobenzoyl-glutamate utilization protein B